MQRAITGKSNNLMSQSHLYGIITTADEGEREREREKEKLEEKRMKREARDAIRDLFTLA